MSAHIACDKKEAASIIWTHIDDIMVYSDGSGLKGNVGAVAVATHPSATNSCRLQFQLGKSTDHMVFEAEVMGLTLAAELVRAEGYMESAEIGTDSQVAFQAMRNTRGTSGQHLLDKFQDQILAAQSRHSESTVMLRWSSGDGIR